MRTPAIAARQTCRPGFWLPRLGNCSGSVANWTAYHVVGRARHFYGLPRVCHVADVGGSPKANRRERRVAQRIPNLPLCVAPRPRRFVFFPILGGAFISAF